MPRSVAANQLLIGSVAALLELEKESATSQTISRIRLSTLVEAAVSSRIKFGLTRMQVVRIAGPRWLFYALVFVARIFGAYASFHEQGTWHPATSTHAVSTHAVGEII